MIHQFKYNPKRMKKGEEEAEDNGWSEIRLAVEELSLVKKHAETQLSTIAFITVSNLLLQVLGLSLSLSLSLSIHKKDDSTLHIGINGDWWVYSPCGYKIGPTMAVLRHDIQRNIERLEELYVSDPSIYSSLTEILKKEMSEGTTRKIESCAKAILWLTRSMSFSVALLERLEKDSELSLAQSVEEAYRITLKPWHGWISATAYRVAVKLIPERKIFISLLLGKGQDYKMLKVDIQNFISLLQPLLNETNAHLKEFRLDRLKST